MTEPRPTPETDKVTFRVLSNLQSGTDEVVYSEHARRLERERDEARELVQQIVEMDDHDYAGICVRASEYLEWLDRARALLAKDNP